MSIVTHQVRSVAAIDTPYDDFFRLEHMRGSAQGLHSIFSTTQAFLEGDTGIIAFKTYTGDVMTVTPSGYSLLEASYEDNAYSLGITGTGDFDKRVRFATLSLNPLEQPGDNLALLSVNNELLLYKLEKRQLTKYGEFSLSEYLASSKSSRRQSFSDDKVGKDDLAETKNVRTAASTRASRALDSSDKHDILDTLIASYQSNISAKLPTTKSSEDITKHSCSCSVGREMLAFSVYKSLYLMRLSDFSYSMAMRRDDPQGSQTSAAKVPVSILKHTFTSAINSLHILSDSPKEAIIAVSSGSVCTIVKATGLDTSSPKVDLRIYPLSQAVSRDSLAYVTTVAVSPFVTDYWILGTNQGQLLIITSKSDNPVFSTMLFSLPIISISFSALQPDIFSVASRHKIMVCQYVSTFTIISQFISPQFVSIISGGIHCIAPSQPLSLWYGLDNNKIVFESMGINYPKWTRRVVSSFLRNAPSMQIMYDKVSCACCEYGPKFVDSYITFSSLLYSREFKQCYSLIFSLVNTIDESGMKMATELMQYFFGLLRPLQQYYQASQTTSVPRPVPPMPSLSKVLSGFNLSVPSSLNKKYCLMPSVTEALQYSAYEMRFRLDDTCGRMKISEGQIQEKLLKELDILLDRAIEVCLKVKDDPIVSLVLLRSIFDVALLIDRKRHGVTIYKYFSGLLDVMRATPSTAATFLKPIYPSTLSLRGTMRLDEFFIAAVSPIKHVINSFGDGKDNKHGDLKWSEHAIWALYTGVVHQATRTVADAEYRDNASNTEYTTLTTLLSQQHPSSRNSIEETITSFTDLCEKQDKLFAAISESNKVPMTPEAFAKLLDAKSIGSQFVLLETLYGYIYSHTSIENSHKLQEVCAALIAVFHNEIIGIRGHRQSGFVGDGEFGATAGSVAMGAAADRPIDVVGGSRKDEIYKHFGLKETTTPVKKYESIFVPLPTLGVVYGFIMTVFWPRALHELSSRMNSMTVDGLSEFLDDLCEILTNVYLMANISPNEFIERYVPGEVCNMFKYNVQGTRVRGILEKFIKMYMANVKTTTDPAKIAIYQRDAATCKRLMRYFAETRLSEFESTIEKLQREISKF